MIVQINGHTSLLLKAETPADGARIAWMQKRLQEQHVTHQIEVTDESVALVVELHCHGGLPEGP